MHPLRTILCCCLLSATPVFAAEGDKVLRFPSPKGDLVLTVVQRAEGADTVELKGASGKEFLSFIVDDELKEGEVKDGSVVWSPNSDGVAFAAGNKNALKAFAFIRTKEEWKPLKLPEPGDKDKVWEGAQVQPSKWQGKQLVLTISGSHGGRSGAPAYTGTMTVAVDPEAGVAKKIEQRIAVENDDKESH